MIPERSACSHPLENRVVVIRALLEPQTAAVRDLRRRLEQKQALLRVPLVDARDLRPPGLRTHHLINAALDDPLVVFVRMPGVIGEPEAVLALDPTVTGRTVAAAFGQDPTDISGETQRLLLRRSPDTKPRRRLPVADDRLDPGLSIRQGVKKAVRIDTPHGAVRQNELGLRGQINAPAISQRADHDQLLDGIGPVESSLFRRQLDRGQLGRRRVLRFKVGGQLHKRAQGNHSGPADPPAASADGRPPARAGVTALPRAP